MPYTWVADNDARVIAGTQSPFTWGGVIQNPDADGGCNTLFTLGPQGPRYHVHFFAGSAQVRAIRYFALNQQQGDTILGYVNGTRKSLAGLRHDAETWQPPYVNFVTFLTAMRAAMPVDWTCR